MDYQITFLYFLLILNCIVPIAFTWAKCRSSAGIQINHVMMFSTGYLFYWIFPLILGESHVVDTDTLLGGWNRAFNSIPLAVVVTYLLFATGIYSMFILGTIVGEKVKFVSSARQSDSTPSFLDRIKVDSKLLIGFLIVGIIIAAVYAVILRNELFRGYLNGVQDAGPRGTFVAANSFLLVLAFVYTIFREPTNVNKPFLWRIANPYFITYSIVAILVLSLGGRLYVVSSVVMLLVYRTVYDKRFSQRGFLILVGGMIFAVGVLGSIRLGGGTSPFEVVANLFSESIGTSVSLISFLRAGRLELLNAPRFLMYDFVNLIPSFLFPGKQNFILAPEDFGYDLTAPLGARHLAASLMINFGMLGSLPVIFLAAFYMSRLRRSSVRLHKVNYIMITGWIGFSFFRDAFSISVVKSIFQFSILVPILLIICAGMLRSLLLPSSFAALNKSFNSCFR